VFQLCPERQSQARFGQLAVSFWGVYKGEAEWVGIKSLIASLWRYMAVNFNLVCVYPITDPVTNTLRSPA